MPRERRPSVKKADVGRFARDLKRAREKAGLSQAELARRARTVRAHITQLESGVRRNVGLALARRLAAALGIPLYELRTP